MSAWECVICGTFFELWSSFCKNLRNYAFFPLAGYLYKFVPSSRVCTPQIQLDQPTVYMSWHNLRPDSVLSFWVYLPSEPFGAPGYFDNLVWNQAQSLHWYLLRLLVLIRVTTDQSSVEQRFIDIKSDLDLDFLVGFTCCSIFSHNNASLNSS